MYSAAVMNARLLSEQPSLLPLSFQDTAMSIKSCDFILFCFVFLSLHPATFVIYDLRFTIYDFQPTSGSMAQGGAGLN